MTALQTIVALLQCFRALILTFSRGAGEGTKAVDLILRVSETGPRWH